jgi:hypothetical protein
VAPKINQDDHAEKHERPFKFYKKGELKFTISKIAAYVIIASMETT